MKLEVPEALELEHAELHTEIADALKSGGETAKAAKALVQELHPHFLKEEKYALRPLGALQALSKGNVPSNPSLLRTLTDKLRDDLPTMLAEHKAILAAARRLAAAARKEKKPTQVRFAAKLKLHAQTEETVLYPAAILIGDYLKLRGCPWVR